MLRLTLLVSNELVSYSILVSDIRSQMLNIPDLKGLGPLLKKETALTNVAGENSINNSDLPSAVTGLYHVAHK